MIAVPNEAPKGMLSFGIVQGVRMKEDQEFYRANTYSDERYLFLLQPGAAQIW